MLHGVSDLGGYEWKRRFSAHESAFHPWSDHGYKVVMDPSRYDVINEAIDAQWKVNSMGRPVVSSLAELTVWLGQTFSRDVGAVEGVTVMRESTRTWTLAWKYYFLSFRSDGVSVFITQKEDVDGLRAAPGVLNVENHVIELYAGDPIHWGKIKDEFYSLRAQYHEFLSDTRHARELESIVPAYLLTTGVKDA